VQPFPINSRLRGLRGRLLEHSLYTSLETADDVRAFMSRHVYCVWDFMSLLKSLQRRLTCVTVPWTPVADAESCRLVNEIVLGEESDEDGAGGHCSHFELYLGAMRDAGADVRGIETFLARLRAGAEVKDALRAAAAAPAVAAFVEHTVALAQSPDVWRVAAGFALGREDVIPGMFVRLLERLTAREPGRFGRFLYYLRRHVDLDGDSHGPAALRLLARLCEGDADKVREANETASGCLQQRLAVWDEIQRAR
jgi:hypothetical protein